MRDDDLPLLLVGAGGAFAAVALIGRALDRGDDDRRAEITSVAAIIAGSWVFPVPDLGDRRPEISDGWGSRRVDDDGERRLHLGADVMFRRRSRGDLATVFSPGAPNGTRGYFMPDDVPALAAGAGVVVFAAWTRRGFTVRVRHPEGWTTYYTHLARLEVDRGQVVVAGQRLGTIGHDPMDQRRLMHLHFELWRGDNRDGATNPAPYLLAWQRRAMPGWSPPTRNGGLAYRPVGGRGEAYPAWLRALKGASGVYVIREHDGARKPVVYVGESHTGRLYETLTRHFQAWRRWKGFWKGQYGEGHDPGLTYDRGGVEVAAKVTAAADALDEEARLIRRLRPRDNLLGQPAEDVPF